MHYPPERALCLRRLAFAFPLRRAFRSAVRGFRFFAVFMAQIVLLRMAPGNMRRKRTERESGSATLGTPRLAVRLAGRQGAADRVANVGRLRFDRVA